MATDVVNPSFYADFGALTTLGKQAKQNDPQAIREAARQFESLFTDMMLKSMRAAKLGEGLGDSQETDFYQDMYDQQLAVQMSQGKGLGLADMLVQQLTRSGAVGASKASGQSASPAGAMGVVGTVSGPGTPVSTDARATVATGTLGRRGDAAIGAAGIGSKRSGTAGAPANGSKAGRGAALHQRIGFIQKLAPYAQRAAAALGVSADTLIAQAALETGWGRHVASGTTGSSSNNLFGVKAGTSWQGATASATTTEYAGSSAQHLAQTFRSYGSVQQGVGDYVALLQGRAAYQGALSTGSNASAFGSALQRGGYATDPDYVHKLVATTAAVHSLRSLVATAPSGITNAPGAVKADAVGAAAEIAGSFKLLADVPIQDGEETA